MTFMQNVIGILLLVFLGLVIYSFIKKYRETSGTVKERLISAYGSLTILWQRFVTLIASGIGSLVWLADLLNAPGVASAIQTWMQPEYVALAMVLIAIVSELARRRGGSSDPVK